MNNNRSSYQKRYYQQNKEKINAKSQAYHEAYPEKRREAAQKSRETNYEQAILSRCKANAKRLGLDFNLDISDIVIPTHCPYLGVELTRIHGKGRVQTNPSIDRVIPSLGYTKGNIQIISDMANRMKQDASKEQLITFAQSVLGMYLAS